MGKKSYGQLITMQPYLAAFWNGDNVGETKQLKQKLQELYNDHIFLSILKGIRTLFALEMWLSTWSMKNYSPLRIALKTKLGGLQQNSHAMKF